MKKFYVLFILIFLSSYFFGQETDTTVIKDETEFTIPTFSLTEMENEGNGQSQEIAGLLQSSRDIFTSQAGYTFGPARFRIRGYDSENLSVLMGGVPLNDMETGRAYWSNWGGLNDVTRNSDIKTGIVASDYAFGGVAGVTRIIARPSTYRKQLKVSYALSNRSYRNRIMITWASGVSKKGWSFVLSGSHRWAKEGYVEGTFYDAWAYWVGVEKRFNSRHSISLLVFGAPSSRGRAGPAIQEAYDLSGSNFYNPYWGYQNGEKRNARVSRYHQPVITFTHYGKLSDNITCQGSLTYWFGKGGSTALNWTDGGDPRPDYYRYLPSYWLGTGDQETADFLTNQWKTNKEFRQIRWDAMYFANSKWLNTIDDVNGIEGNTVTGYRSKYIIEDRRNDKQDFLFNWHLNSFVNDNITIIAGINLNWHKGFHYKKIDDLLGGEWWLDVDKYAEGDPYKFPAKQQNNLDNPNNLVTVGDVFGYDYTATVNRQEAFGQADFTYRKVDFYVSLDFSHTVFWRTGNMRNGRYPDNSLGDSPKQNFYNYGAKAGVTYKINGRNYLVLNGMYLTRAPFFWNSYVSPYTREFTVENLTSEKIFSGDLSYILRSPAVKARLTLYYTQFRDQNWRRSFYIDILNSFVNYMMTGVDKQSMGLEFGIEANVTPTVTLTGVLGLGQYIYTSRPVATIVSDNTSEVLARDRKVYFENYYVGGSPQTIASVGVKYFAPKYWFIGLNGNYMGNAYLGPNPDRRTEQALDGFWEGDVRISDVLHQEKLNPGYTVDLFGGKSWRIKHKYYIGFTLGISNLLNNTDYAMSGFEQLRYDPTDINKFPPKYYYLYGRNFYFNVYFRM